MFHVQGNGSYSAGLMMLCGLAVLCLCVPASGMLFESQADCMAADQCHCSRNTIACSGHLTAVPTFTPTGLHIDNLTIVLAGNDLTELRPRAFENINSTGATSITILFQSNKLHHMDMAAFAGIEDAVTVLHLEDNRLSGIPAALTTLTRLQRLYMPANPVTTIDPVVTSLMAPTLTYFWFFAQNTTAWPYGINHLRHLEHLQMHGIPLHRLPLDAFSGFASYLTNLDIGGEFFAGSDPPSAVCLLRNLKSLTVNRNHWTSQQEILTLHEKCRELMEKVPSSIHIQ